MLALVDADIDISHIASATIGLNFTQLKDKVEFDEMRSRLERKDTIWDYIDLCMRFPFHNHVFFIDKPLLKQNSGTR